MDSISNCQFSGQPSKGGFLSKIGWQSDFRMLFIFPLIFLLGIFSGTEVFGQVGVVNPATPFNIDPNNPPACPQNNLQIVDVDFRDPNTGVAFEPNDLVGTPIGTPIDGDIFVTFAVSGQGYNFHVQFDLIIDGVNQGQQALCIVVEDAQGNTINITNGLELKVADFTWNYGTKVEIKNVYQTWITGNAKPNDKTCPATAGNSQCDYVGEGFVVETPVAANFEFETFCENLNASFTNLSTGGADGVAFSYSWDFGDGNTSTETNLTHTYDNAGTYSVTLTATKGIISDEETFDVTVNDPIILTIKSPPAVCSPGTVDLTAAAVTNGSSADLVYTYWTDDLATIELDDPDAVATSGTYFIKATDPLTNCEVIKPVVVSVGACSLTLVKEATNGPAGEDCLDPTLNPTINYSFTVTNNGDYDLTNIQISDPLFEAPNALVDFTLFDNGNGDATLGVGETWIYTATYAITPADIEAGQVQNQASVSGDANGFTASDLSGSLADNDEPTIVPICQDPVIEIVKTGLFNDENADTFANVDETITYTFLVSNGGDVSLSNISVTDPLPGLSTPIYVSGDTGDDGILATDEIWTYTATYSVTQDDINTGQVDNTATADSNESEEDTDDETVLLAQDASIMIEKTASQSTYNAAGDVITYTFEVTNNGNVTLTEVT
ncbi:PKD domain-containing protein, partial [Algoriphagus sp. C2-6-M1]|uniref:DUF7507 domain-containing protein n=1 Tax=Algoriphagus persicinus TaxID=3108754 RepID=UPI002B37778B